MQSMLLKEAKPVNKVSNQGKCQTPPRETGIDVCVLDVESKNESYLLPEVLKKEPDHKPSHEPPHKWKSNVEQCVQMPRLKNVENFSGCKGESFKEIPPDNLLLLGESKPKMVRTEPTRSMKDHPLKEIRNAKVKSRG
ncbi:hypothetical protein IGI04_036402, partial [Brassica rapa subsp. trilocularis]